MKLARLFFIFALHSFNQVLGQSTYQGAQVSSQLLGRYEKSSTPFVGKTSEDSQITYLQIQDSMSAHFPLRSVGTIKQTADLMVQFFYQKSLTEINPAQGEQFFRFGEDINCFFTTTTTIECNTPERKRLLVSYDKDYQSRWLSFTLAIKEGGESYIQIRDGLQIIAFDQNENFIFIQNEVNDPELCFGLCVQGYRAHEKGFVGNIREVFAKNSYIPYEELSGEHINIMKQYDFYVLGYYRCKDAYNEFNSQQLYLKMVNDAYILNGMEQSSEVQVYGQYSSQNLPIDMCPRTFLTRHLVEFTNNGSANDNLQINQHRLKTQLESTDWSYTYSATFYHTRDNCHYQKASEAQKYCHLIWLDGVFMLYFAKPNGARFHFFAERDFYQTQTPIFFIPYNQWITVQVSLSQFKGYEVVVLNAEGDILLNFSREYNMQRQDPTGTLSLFQGYAGLVSRVKLNKKRTDLPAILFRINNALIDLNFKDVIETTIFNDGSSGLLTFNQMPVLKSVAYLLYEFGQPKASWDEEREHFDGVTCDDRHLTLCIRSGDDPVEFLMEYKDQQNKMQSTIQFWFKYGQEGYYEPKQNQYAETVLFELERKEGKYEYWSIFLRDYSLMKDTKLEDIRELVIAPFGRQKSASGDMFITFSELKLENASESGWWHLSCSLIVRQKVECILHNSVHTFVKSFDLSNYQIILDIPQAQYKGIYYSGVDKLYLKDFRFYSRSLDHKDVNATRYQLDNYEEMIFQTNFLNYTQYLQPEFRVKERHEFKESNDQLVRVVDKLYHAVCPSYTYWFDNQCYNQPVNKLIINIFPWLNKVTKDSFWRFTIEQSQFVSKNISKQLGVKFSTNDASLNEKLDKNIQIQFSRDIKQHHVDIPSNWLRHQDQYSVEALISDGNFEVYNQIEFVPNKCHWFIVTDWDSYDARITRSEKPGTQDIRFNLELQINPKAECNAEFNYYNVFDFDAFDYEFVVDNDRMQFMNEKPVIKADPIYESNAEDSLSGIILTIPKAEQYKLPVWTDIKVIIKIAWKSSEPDAMPSSALFQNVMVNLNLQPATVTIAPMIKTNTNQVSRGQTLIITANSTSITGVQPDFVQDFMKYVWSCPEIFNDFCEKQQNNPTIYIPYDDIDKAKFNLTQNRDFYFELEAELVRPDNGQSLSMGTSTKIRWFAGLEMPKFKITCNEINIDSNVETFCKITGDGFDADWAIKSYDIEWTTSPPVRNTIQYQDGQFYTFNPSELSEDTDYTFVAELKLKNLNEVNDSIKFDFKTGNRTTTAQSGQRRLEQEQLGGCQPLKRELQIDSSVSFRTIFDQKQYFEKHWHEPHSQISVEELDHSVNGLLKIYKEKDQTEDLLDVIQILLSFAKEASLDCSGFVPLIDRAFEIDSDRFDKISDRLLLLPFNQNFLGDNFALVSTKFNYKLADNHYEQVLVALNAQVTMKAADLYWQLPQQPTTDFYFQMRAIKNPLAFNQLPDVYLRIVDSVDGTYYSISEFDGNAEVSFFLTETDGYKPNQTICHVKHTTYWSSNMCLTEVDFTMRLLNCTCNLIESQGVIGIVNDVTREVDQDIPHFTPLDYEHVHKTHKQKSEIEIMEEETIIAELTVEVHDKELARGDVHGTSFFFILVVILISVTQVGATLYCYRLDRLDERIQKSPVSKDWQLNLLKQVSDHMNQPLEYVKLRKRQLYQMQATVQTPFLFVFQAVHPLIAPFAVYRPGQSRMLRFNAYWNIVNLWVICCISYFIVVEAEVSNRLGKKELQYQELMWSLGAFFLLPLFSNALVEALKDKVVEQVGEVKPKCKRGRDIFYVFAFFINILMLTLMGIACATTKYPNQFMMTLSIIGSLLIGFIFTNMLRVLYNAKCPTNLFKSKHAIEILRDIGFIKGLQTIYNHNTPKKDNDQIELRNVVTTEQPIALDTQTEAAADTERNPETDRRMVNKESESEGQLEIKSKYRKNVKINEEVLIVPPDQLDSQAERQIELEVEQTIKAQHNPNVIHDDSCI